ncbi:MAG: hypothetical protein JXA14_02920 [Anaerolineae bacterium]|nr:hypothetical protein [Anaerolineae bacterium]
MIDDYERAMELLHEIEAQLPIPAQPTAMTRRALRDRGGAVPRDCRLFVDSAFYAGDEGGIMCGIKLSDDGKEVLAISITHLRIDLRHPLAKKIRAYQEERKRRLAQSGRSREPSSFTLYPRRKGGA